MLVVFGFGSWIIAIFVWVGAQSAIHQILAAILALNGSVLLGAGQLSYDLASLKSDIQRQQHAPEPNPFIPETPLGPIGNSKMNQIRNTAPVFKD